MFRKVYRLLKNGFSTIEIQAFLTLRFKMYISKFMSIHTVTLPLDPINLDANASLNTVSNISVTPNEGKIYNGNRK